MLVNSLRKVLKFDQELLFQNSGFSFDMMIDFLMRHLEDEGTLG